MDDLKRKGQTITYSGVGAYHQNGIAKTTIKTITLCAGTMMLHALLHWHEMSDLELWPFAMDYAIQIWNNMPKQDGQLSPIEYMSKKI